MEPFYLVNQRARTHSRGFTLIELLVVIAIIIVITGVVLSGESNFNRSFLLTNTTYDVALSYRTAQSYGLASQQYAGVLNAGYGIHLGALPVTSYILFADTNPTAAQNAAASGMPVKPSTQPGNNKYDGGAEMVQTYALSSGFTISDYCGTLSNGSTVCASSGGTSWLDVVFERPNEQPSITGSLGGSVSTFIKACVTVRSSSATYQYISIAQTGEISLASSCP